MFPVLNIINSFEKLPSFLPRVFGLVDNMSNYSSKVLVYLAEMIYPVNKDLFKSKTVEKIDFNHLNPFLTSPKNSLPFLLKSVSKPLAQPEYVDFGDHAIFHTSGGQKLGSRWIFDLIDHPGFKIYKTIGIENLDDVQKIEPFLPMQEIFDIEALEKQLMDKNVSDLDKEIIFGQLLILHKEYRSQIFNTLNLSTHLAVSTSKTGEWQIFKEMPQVLIGDLDLETLNQKEIDIIAGQIARYFHLEMLFGLNFLGETPHFFDEAAVSALFTVSETKAYIKESVEFPSFLTEDINKRHAIFKTLMEKCYPRQLAEKIWKNDSDNMLEKSHHLAKMNFLLGVLKQEDFENGSPVISQILKVADELLMKGLELQSNPKMSIEAILIKNWLKLNSEKSAFHEGLENEIFELAEKLIKNVPTKLDNSQYEKTDFEMIVENHLTIKSEISSKIYALLANESSDEALFMVYEKAAELTLQIMQRLNDVKLVLMSNNDPWENVGDHFFKTFAEDFLRELEVFLTLIENSEESGSLKNQLLQLQIKRKHGFEISQNNFLTIFHRYINQPTLDKV